VTLVAKLIKITGFQHMIGLQHLEEFHFSLEFDNQEALSASDKGISNWISSWCIQNLPKLKKISYNGVDNKFTPVISGTLNLEAIHTYVQFSSRGAAAKFKRIDLPR